MSIVFQALSLSANVVSGIGVVLANKMVFTVANFRFPTALTAIHYLSNTAVLALIPVHVQSTALPDRPLLYGITAIWALHNALSNYSLSANSVGLYQVSKVLVTPMIVLLEFLVYRKVPHPVLGMALVGACVGVALATVSDVSVEISGAALALLSCACSSVLKVLQQDVLQRRRWSSLELMRRTWGMQTLLLILCTPLLDPSIAKLATYHVTANRVGLLLLSCLAAFALNLSSLSAIKLTSAISLVLLSQAKTVTTLVLGYLFFDGHPTGMQLAGSALAIVSLGAYTYGSMQLKSSTPLNMPPIETPKAPTSGAGSGGGRGRLDDDDSDMEQQPLRHDR